MKKIFSLSFVALVFFCGAAGAGPAYVGFVNAVGLETKTDLKVGGNSVKPAGFSQGNYIESFGMPEGDYTFACTNGEADPVSASLKIEPSKAPLYVLYKIDVPQPDGKVKHVLKLTGIPGQPRAGTSRRFIGFYASGKPDATVSINGAQTSFPSLKPVVLEGKDLTVGIDEAQPVHYGPTETGNFVLILFDASNGHLRQVLLKIE